MASLTTIANLALGRLGHELITDIDDEADHLAARLKSQWDALRDEVLRSATWTCCTARKAIPADTETPDFGYSYQFTLPDDLLRITGIGINRYEEWTPEGRKVLCNVAGPLNIRYVFRGDTGDFDALLVNALAWRWAMENPWLTQGGRGEIEDIQNDYKEALMQARHIDSLSHPPDMLNESEWLDARRGSLDRADKNYWGWWA